MKKSLLALLFLLLTCQVRATKAYPLPVVVRQSDGTQLTVIGRGDEELHYYLTTDGVLLCHEGNDFFIAQVNDDGSLSATTLLAHEKENRNELEQQSINEQDKAKFEEYISRHQKGISRRREPIDARSHTYFPHSGQPKVVVILAQFSDDKFIDEDPKSVFDQYLNAEVIDNSVGNQTVGKNYGSVRKYFQDMSGGLFEPQFDIYGPVTLPHPTAYYGEGNDDMSLFIPDVCTLAAEEGVDFSPYDANDDGIVDLVYVIYAGYAESISGNASTCIWPKSGVTYANVSDKRIYRYGVNAELNGFPGCWPSEPFQRIAGIGLFCHEFSHCMGMPDFYPTSKSAQNAMNPGMEMWSLMDNGEYAQNGYSPTAYTAWEREAFEWFKIDTLKTSGTYQLRNIDGPGGNAYRIMNDENPSEYFILQNIQKSGWNHKMYGHGMLVTHVDYDQYAFTLSSNSVNNTIGRSRMTVVPADNYLLNWYEVGKGKTATDYYQNHAGDPYPGTADVHDIPLFTTYTGTMKARIESIEESDGIITFYYDNGTTGIRDILRDTEKQTKIYTVDGRFAGSDSSSLPKGIYVVRGRKVVIY